MKNKILSLSILLLCGLAAFPQKSSFKRWDIGLLGGFGMNLGDNADKGSIGFSGGGSMKLSLNNRFALRFQVLSVGFNSENSLYKTQTRMLDMNGQMIINAVSFRKKKSQDSYGVHPLFSNLYFGLGAGKYDANVSYSINFPGAVTNVNGWELIGTLGYKVMLSKVVDFSMEYSMRATYTDNLDGYNPISTTNKTTDFYGVTMFGLHFNFGGKDKSIEYTDGMEDYFKKLAKKEKDEKKKLECCKNFEDIKKDLEELKKLKEDSDNDGVSDYFDKEPNSPSNQVDLHGVILDTDKDTIPDYQDKCPLQMGPKPDGCPTGGYGYYNGGSSGTTSKLNIPAGAQGNRKYIGAAPAGGSRTATKGTVSKGGARKTTKQANADNAENGTENPVVETPKVRFATSPDESPMARRIASRGTSAQTKVKNPETYFQNLPEPGKIGEPIEGIGEIQFRSGRAVIKVISYTSLNKIVRLMNENPDVTLRIEGYTDNKGNALGNIRLSQKRADAVKAYLVARGIDAERILTFGYGAENPIADNETPEGRTLNRRVDLLFE